MQQKAFTLIEMLVVISVIAILLAIVSPFNRKQISYMQAMNEREQWLSRHKHWNNLLISSNYINKQKIESWLDFQYNSSWITIVLANENEEEQTPIDQFFWKNQKFSGHITIHKNPLQLWCTIKDDDSQPYIELIDSENHYHTFSLNTDLCTREAIKS